VRLQLYQWEEALKGEWVDRDDVPEEFNNESMLVTFQTGKGADHLVPVMFPSDTFVAMKHLTDPEVRRQAEVASTNCFIFESTHCSISYASWMALYQSNSATYLN